MELKFPLCNRCKKPMETGNFYGYCTKCHKKNSKKTPSKSFKPVFQEWAESTKNKIAIIGLTFILSLFIVPWVFGTIVMAYDNFIINQMEIALKGNVEATQQNQKACEANYQSLLRYKIDNKIALQGSGDPCPLN